MNLECAGSQSTRLPCCFKVSPFIQSFFRSWQGLGRLGHQTPAVEQTRGSRPSFPFGLQNKQKRQCLRTRFTGLWAQRPSLALRALTQISPDTETQSSTSQAQKYIPTCCRWTEALGLMTDTPLWMKCDRAHSTGSQWQLCSGRQLNLELTVFPGRWQHKHARNNGHPARGW